MIVHKRPVLIVQNYQGLSIDTVLVVNPSNIQEL